MAEKTLSTVALLPILILLFKTLQPRDTGCIPSLMLALPFPDLGPQVPCFGLDPSLLFKAEHKDYLLREPLLTTLVSFPKLFYLQHITHSSSIL